MFGVFMLTWFLARHVLYMITMWSIWKHMAEVIPIGCYHGAQDNFTGPIPLPEHGWLHSLEPFRNPSGIICYSNNVRWGFLGALGFLQLLTVFWFVLIVQVAVRVIKGIGADDIRSDNDSSDIDNAESDSGLQGHQLPELTVEIDVSWLSKRVADRRKRHVHPA
ncbi:hypothetical protein UA08_09218 [Talaromyces atroroseus]|uniref:TLC domain-containing protein n=1 Tax=Talaromyces atroroseus TaxID=1441469 RepID=A0A1Q5Q6Q8_TALAT|nr:hypothetical protein UA08_09218 [Talaromyces atroroseus]OKL55529.1 hypothetical protein UA08_09218 [Talaromyces atroroseus]